MVLSDVAHLSNRALTHRFDADLSQILMKDGGYIGVLPTRLDIGAPSLFKRLLSLNGCDEFNARPEALRIVVGEYHREVDRYNDFDDLVVELMGCLKVAAGREPASNLHHMPRDVMRTYRIVMTTMDRWAAVTGDIGQMIRRCLWRHGHTEDEPGMYVRSVRRLPGTLYQYSLLASGAGNHERLRGEWVGF